MTLQIEPLGPAIGATVRGLSLSQPLSDDDRDALQSALHQHHVLFFDDQTALITPLQQRALVTA